MAVILTDKLILELPITGKQYDVYDAIEKGLILRVNKNGSKSFSYQYGRGKRVKFAKFGELPLKLTRLKAKELIINAKNNQSISKPLYDDLTFGNYLAEIDYPWMKANLGTAKATFDNLKAAFFTDFRDVNLKDLSVKTLERWKNNYVANIPKHSNLNSRKASANRLIGSLKASLRRAEELEIIDQSPIYKLKAFKLEKSEHSRYLSKEERFRFYEALAKFDKYFQVIVTIALNTGLRRGSILTLKWSDVHFTDTRNYLVIEACNIKTKKTHHISLNQAASNALSDWKQTSSIRSEWVFPNPITGKPYQGVRRAWNKLLKLSNVKKFTFRDQRHDCASSLAQRNVSLYKISKILGHSSPKMSQRYAYLHDESLHSALCLLDSSNSSKNETNLSYGT